MSPEPRRVPSLSLLARAGGLAAAALALLASTEAGERADGSCPADETCSPDTPDGLLFEGAPLGSWPALTAHTIATGGRQTFRISLPSGGGFDLPYTPAVTGAGRSVLAVGPGAVVVGAEANGVGYLRIVDGAGLLYDRISLDSETIAEVTASPSYVAAYPELLPARWAAFAGGQAAVTIGLEGTSGVAVVDEDLAVRATIPLRRTSWDTVTLTPSRAGFVPLTVDAGTVTGREVPVPVVDRIDRVAVTGHRESGVGGEISVCFSAWLDNGTSFPNDDTLVIGAPRQYRVTGPATPQPMQEFPSCLTLLTTAAGTVRIDASVGALTATATVDVRGGAARQATGFGAWLQAPSEGERASMIEE